VLNEVEEYCRDGRARVVMGPVWDAAKAMGLCCGFPVEGEPTTSSAAAALLYSVVVCCNVSFVGSSKDSGHVPMWLFTEQFAAR
jgi:hypothetical protein